MRSREAQALAKAGVANATPAEEAVALVVVALWGEGSGAAEEEAASSSSA